MGIFMGRTVPSADPSTVWLADLIEAAEVLAASAEPCDAAIVRAFSHRLEMPGLPLLPSEVPFIGSSPKLRWTTRQHRFDSHFPCPRPKGPLEFRKTRVDLPKKK
jgi:hypothetical protein